MTTIFQGLQRSIAVRRPEAGPTSARIEFFVRTKQGGIAADAVIDAIAFMVVIGTCKGGFCTTLAGYAELLITEHVAPFFLGFFNLTHCGLPEG